MERAHEIPLNGSQDPSESIKHSGIVPCILSPPSHKTQK